MSQDCNVNHNKKKTPNTLLENIAKLSFVKDSSNNKITSASRSKAD